MPRPLLGMKRCRACGALGHTAGADGLCSPSAQARQAMADGASFEDAARVFGVKTWNLRTAIMRAELRTAPTGAQLRAYRRVVIADRALWYAGRWAGGTSIDKIGESAMLEWPPEMCEPPAVDARGADHPQIPDPPCLWCVGWRTSTGQV